MTSTACPQCGVNASPDASRCAACGAPLKQNSAREQQSARQWLAVVSVLTLVTGLMFYMKARSDVGAEVRKVESVQTGVTPEERDRILVQQTGKTFDQLVAKDMNRVNLLFTANIVLSGLYFGLWLWSRRNLFAATMTALLLFGATLMANAWIEPMSMVQGMLVKLLVFGMLVRAAVGGFQARSPPAISR